MSTLRNIWAEVKRLVRDEAKCWWRRQRRSLVKGCHIPDKVGTHGMTGLHTPEERARERVEKRTTKMSAQVEILKGKEESGGICCYSREKLFFWLKVGTMDKATFQPLKKKGSFDISRREEQRQSVQLADVYMKANKQHFSCDLWNCAVKSQWTFLLLLCYLSIYVLEKV